MGSFHILSYSPWRCLCISWWAHTVDGYQLRVVHRKPALECDCLARTWRDRPIEAVLLTGMPKYLWCHRYIAHQYWWPCVAIWFQLSCASSSLPAEVELIQPTDWSSVECPGLTTIQQCSYHYGLIYANLHFPGYVVHTPQPLLEFTKCTVCIGQARCDVTDHCRWLNKLECCWQLFWRR